MLNTFLFDLDGTLTDSQEGIVNCILYALQELDFSPLPSRVQLSGYIGMSLSECFSIVLGADSEPRALQAVELYRKRFAVEGKFENKVYAGIPEALARLGSGENRLYVATSKPVGFAREILDHFDLAKYFSSIYGSELDGRLENKADLIAYVIEREQLTASTTVMIGDRRYDILGGKSNNTTTAGVTWGYGTPDELRQAGADSILNRPEELATLRTPAHQVE